MAEGTATEAAVNNPEPVVSAGVDMEVMEISEAAEGGKRAREEQEGANGDATKKQKVEESADGANDGAGEGEEKVGGESSVEVVVSLGPKKFGTSTQMFDYFFKLLHAWPSKLDLNKYEHLVLVDLLKKGHQESEEKIGSGVRSFQIRDHPMWKSQCFFLVREDGSVEDFSFRKCVDNILPLPEELKGHGGGNGGKGHGGRGGGGGRGGRGRGRGRGRKW
ncbi:unnamed protein product [Linum tenue]|uniref:Uncharacterized protein n=1 Tax=Linum tenue TaxID=586396 RepID=A0AAV0LAT0_9ROSI|nr:unnamed protein product [Linum tenue]